MCGGLGGAAAIIGTGAIKFLALTDAGIERGQLHDTQFDTSWNFTSFHADREAAVSHEDTSGGLKPCGYPTGSSVTAVAVVSQP